ncbi:photosystem I reaction center subunit IV [Hahella sp. CCB-MM4]|uniref:WD40/YVTN/BNR-like repeat-containing protein n=1 Tax=Hahella sp. (strain CCB-MM4) TaxID=1926491 RepID=UPI000B9A40A3|nr:YCF48-related protein [Hahella sp. CCB-MM4]OZG74004.1 photosystem I reaction center subunit IV [Hahella sp. CCB-MM4]
MRYIKPLRNLLAVCALGLSIGVAGAQDRDVLETPAMDTEHATETLLLDVTSAGNRLVAVGQRGHIIYSDDDGKSWSQASVPVSVLMTAVYFTDEKNGWSVGHGAIILHTVDGGQTWVKQFDGKAANEMVIAQAQNKVARIEKEMDSADEANLSDLEFQLEEAQYALEDAEFDADIGPSKPLLDVWFRDSQVGFVVGAYGFFFKTVDGGQTWSNWGARLDNPERFHLNSINQITGGALFIVGEAGIVHRSTDLGETWEMLESPYDGSLFGVSGNGNVNEVLVYGLRGHLFYSQDVGESWEQVGTDADQTIMAVAIGDKGQLAVVGNSGLMMLSDNYGETFRMHTRDDRLALLGARFLPSDRLLLVGEGGVSVIRGISKLN